MTQIPPSGENFQKSVFAKLKDFFAKNSFITMGLSVVAAFALIAVGFFISKIYLPSEQILQGVRVGGIHIGGWTRDKAKEYLFSYKKSIIDQPVFLHYQKRTWVFLPDYGGLKADVEKTVENAWKIGRRGFFAAQWFERFKVRMNGINLDFVIANDKQSMGAYLQMLIEEIDRPAVSAQIVGGSATHPVVVDEIEGYLLQRNQLRKQLKEIIFKMPPRHIELPVLVQKPKLTKSQIMEHKFELIGTFTTKFDPAVTGRVQNVKLAAQAIHGAVLLPGEIFSYNEIVGPRENTRGFMDAPVLIKGELVPAIGGGICQVSSTLYNAALLARLEILERRNHSRLSAYVSPGQDATIVENYIDLKFKNIFETPVLINCLVLGNRLRVEIWGKNMFPGEKVKLLSVVDKVIPFTRVEKPDPAMPPGARQVEKEGADGYEVSLYRIITLNGKEIKRELVNRSKYITMPEVVRIGPSLPTPSPASERPLIPEEWFI